MSRSRSHLPVLAAPRFATRARGLAPPCLDGGPHYPGMVNRFLVRWSPQDTAPNTLAGYPFSPNDSPTGSVSDSHGYVWHCHIIDHEDNEMMRPDVIIPLPGAPRSFVKGTNY